MLLEQFLHSLKVFIFSPSSSLSIASEAILDILQLNGQHWYYLEENIPNQWLPETSLPLCQGRRGLIWGLQVS